MHVALLHGLGADRRAFQRFERLLPEAWTIRSFDLLGHGEAPKPQTGYALPDHARYMADELRKWAGGEELVVIGHSYGANVSVTLAAQYPDLPRGLVLLDPIVYPEMDGSEDKAQIRSGTEQMLTAKREGALTETVDRLYEGESAPLRGWIVQTWENMSQGVIDEIDHAWWRFAGEVQCPVAIVHGDLDRGGGGDLAADYFDDAKVTRIEGAGHYLHASHARETAAAVADSVAWLLEAAATS
jgi:pimeloyl-ACP methyl ester carboxylesterase